MQYVGEILFPAFLYNQYSKHRLGDMDVSSGASIVFSI